MKKLLLSLTLLISGLSAQASDNRILEIDPYSIDSYEKNFPKAVETETLILKHGPDQYKKHIGPQTKEIKKINYDVLIPHLIAVIQEQHREIEELKRAEFNKDHK